MKLTEDFTINEFIKSDTAKVHHIDNRPSVEVVENLKMLCKNVLQPLRNHIKCPIVITSGYRSKALNEAVGGACNSQHLYGQAADIICPSKKLEDIFMWIKNNLNFDQLLYEHSASAHWIHVSYRNDGKNRKQAIDNYIV